MITQKKILLAIDWTNIMFRALFMSSNFGNDSYDSENELQSFVCKFGQDLSYLFKIFSPDRVLLMTDARNPWRKDLLPKDDLGNGYKANREKNEKWDWDQIFEYADKLKNIMKNKGFDFCEIERGEADDLLCLAKESVFDHYHNYNIILVSSDADIRQLADFNKENKQYCIIYNPVSLKGGIRRFFINKDFFEWWSSEDEQSNDIFFSSFNTDKTRLKNIISMAGNKIKMEIINPDDIVLNKIFCGDNSDNIPSIYTWYNKTGKLSRITDSKFRKLQESLSIKNVNDLILKEDFIKENLETIIKKDISDLDVPKSIASRKILIELNSDNFPDSIKGYKADIESILKEDISFIPKKYNIHELFKDTEFEEYLERKDQAEQRVFKDLDKYIDKNNLNKLW